MMSLPVWLPGPMFLPGRACPGGGSMLLFTVPDWVSVHGGLCLGGLCQGDHLYGEEPAVSILLECILVLFCFFVMPEKYQAPRKSWK